MQTIYVVTTVLVLLGHTQVAAHNADTTITVKMDEVVIAANKSEDRKIHLTQQALVLNRQDIAQAQAQTTADLLANTAGIFVQKSQMGGGSPVLRGFEASRILLVIDGVRMNNLIYRAGHLQNIITVDNAMLERTEVLFGPSSTMYGSDALGGVVHFYTRNPAFAVEGKKLAREENASVRLGSVNNEVTAHADFSVGGYKWASITSVTYSSFDDLKSGKNRNPFYDTIYGLRPIYATRINGVDTLVPNNNKYLQLYSGYQQYDVLQKVAFRPNRYQTHSVNFQYSTSSNIPRYDRLTDPAPGGGLRSAEWYYGPQDRLLAIYSLDHRKETSFFQLAQLNLNYQNIDESRHNRNFKNNNLAHRVENVQMAGANLFLQRNVKNHVVRTGMEHQSNFLSSTAEKENIVTGIRTSLDTRYPSGANSMHSTAVYGSHTWKMNNKFTLTDGVRLGYVSLRSVFEDTTFFKFPFTTVNQNNFVYSGSIGLIHMADKDLKLSGLVSTGFRVPNIDDLAKVFESAPGTIIVPNNQLRPEKTINGELGATKAVGTKIVWENVLYYSRFFDAIVTSPFIYNDKDSIYYNGTKSRVLANQNQRSAFIYGASSGVRAVLNKHFLLSANISYTYGRIMTDTNAIPLDHIPPFQARTQITYIGARMGADFFINYNGKKKIEDYYRNGEDNEQYATPIGMPAWMTLNCRVSYKLNRYLLVQAGIDNVLDTQYRVFASGINGAGRNYFISLRFNNKS